MERTDFSNVLIEKIVSRMTDKNFTASQWQSLCDVSDWLFGGGPGLLISYAGHNADSARDLMEGIWRSVLNTRKAFINGGELSNEIRRELWTSQIGWRTSSDVVREAHLHGREGLLYSKGNGLTDGRLLFLFDVGNPHEEAQIEYGGWHNGSYIKESIMPLPELIEYRLLRRMPTIISSCMDAEGFRAKYGNEAGDKLLEHFTAGDSWWCFF